MDVEGGGRRKGRPKRREMESVNVDLREKGLSGEEVQNWAEWRKLVRNIDPTWEKMRRKKKLELDGCRRYVIKIRTVFCHIASTWNLDVVAYIIHSHVHTF